MVLTVVLKTVVLKAPGDESSVDSLVVELRRARFEPRTGDVDIDDQLLGLESHASAPIYYQVLTSAAQSVV